MMEKSRTFRLAKACEASLCTRGEIQQWSLKGYFSLPPAVAVSSAARKYSLTNIFEFALLKELVSRGVQHENASRLLREQLKISFGLQAKIRGLKFSWESVAKHPEKWLAGTELDPYGTERHFWLLPVLIETPSGFRTRIFSTLDPEGQPGVMHGYERAGNLLNQMPSFSIIVIVPQDVSRAANDRLGLGPVEADHGWAADDPGHKTGRQRQDEIRRRVKKESGDD